MGRNGRFSAGKGFWLCWVGRFLAGCLSWFVALKGHCSESLCYQQSLGLLGHVCFCALVGLPCLVIFIIQPFSSSKPRERMDPAFCWATLCIQSLMRWRPWDGLQSLCSLLGTWWIACELKWRMRHWMETVMASGVTMPSMYSTYVFSHSCSKHVPSLGPFGVRRRISALASGVMGSRRAQLLWTWHTRYNCPKDPMTISRMHQHCINGKAKEMNRITLIIALWLCSARVLQTIGVPKDLVQIAHDLQSPHCFSFLECFSPHLLLYPSPNHPLSTADLI